MSRIQELINELQDLGLKDPKTLGDNKAEYIKTQKNNNKIRENLLLLYKELNKSWDKWLCQFVSKESLYELLANGQEYMTGKESLYELLANGQDYMTDEEKDKNKEENSSEEDKDEEKEKQQLVNLDVMIDILGNCVFNYPNAQRDSDEPDDGSLFIKYVERHISYLAKDGVLVDYANKTQTKPSSDDPEDDDVFNESIGGVVLTEEMTLPNFNQKDDYYEKLIKKYPDASGFFADLPKPSRIILALTCYNPNEDIAQIQEELAHNHCAFRGEDWKKDLKNQQDRLVLKLYKLNKLMEFYTTTLDEFYPKGEYQTLTKIQQIILSLMCLKKDNAEILGILNDSFHFKYNDKAIEMNHVKEWRKELETWQDVHKSESVSND